MRHRLRTTIKWSTTVLTVVLVVLWVGSVWWPVSVGLPRSRVTLSLVTGVLDLQIHDDPIYGNGHWYWTRLYQRPAPLPWGFSWGGFSWSRTHFSGLPDYLRISIPFWFLVLLPALPATWLWYRGHTHAPGLCPTCGYDLRGTKHSVCPECGHG